MTHEESDYLLERRDDGWIIAGYTGDGRELAIPRCIDGIPVVLIANRAFEDSSTIESVEVPETVTFVGNYAFAGCTALERVVMSCPIARLNLGTFWNCPSLVDISLPDTLTEVGDGAFRDCTSLAAISLPPSVKTIGDRAFSGCTSLLTFLAPDSLETIMRSAFLNCTGLASVTVGDSLTYVGPRAFQGCTQLKAVYVIGSRPDAAVAAFFNNHSMSYLVADYAIEHRMVSFEDAGKLLQSELDAERVFGARVATSYPDRLSEIPLKLSMTKALAQYGYVNELRILADVPGFLTPMNTRKCIEIANEAGQIETAAYLLDLASKLDANRTSKNDLRL